MTDIFAHRGSPGVPEPKENTIAAFVAAAQAGADGVELDVWQTAGGELVVHHDRHVPTVGDVTNVSVDRLPGHVPTLAAALDACRAEALAVNVEVKCQGGCEPTAAALAATLDGRPGRFLVSSFHPECLAALRRADARIPLGLLVDWRDDPAAAAVVAVDLGCASLHPFVTQVDGALLALARAAGLDLHVWTVNADADLEAMGRARVAAVITDRVAAARAALALVSARPNGGERRG